MNLLTIFTTLIIVGIVLYLINTFIPMDARIKKIINVAAIVLLIFWLLKVFGVISYLGGIHV